MGNKIIVILIIFFVGQNLYYSEKISANWLQYDTKKNYLFIYLYSIGRKGKRKTK